MANMGIGKLGSSQLIFKRKFRWTLSVQLTCGDLEVEESYVKVAARPNLSVEETEINFLNAKTWIPGKASWETLTVTYYDVAGSENINLWTWLASVYNYMKPVELPMGASRNDYAGQVTLLLYDGCGNALEQWLLQDAWPQAVNFGELDYSSSEECTIEITLRYSGVAYQNLCGPSPTSCCTGCEDGSPGGPNNTYQEFPSASWAG